MEGLTDADLSKYIKRLKQTVARSNPEALLTHRTIDRAIEALPKEPEQRHELLRKLAIQDCSGVARQLLRRLAGALPPSRGRITCHILPNGGTRGTGNCFGADRLLVTVPANGPAVPWLEFVIAHEYSHACYDYDAAAATVRDFLISEGLAMVLAETFASKPQPYPWDEVTAKQEEKFWSHLNPAAKGLEGYMTYMGSEASYEAGARVVRSYLEHHRVSIADAHQLPSPELYWNSGYQRVR